MAPGPGPLVASQGLPGCQLGAPRLSVRVPAAPGGHLRAPWLSVRGPGAPWLLVRGPLVVS